MGSKKTRKPQFKEPHSKVFAAPSGYKTAALFVVIAAAALVYVNTLWNGFVYDDPQEILENWWIRDFRNIPAMFMSNAWGFHEGVKTSNYYRPMMHVFHLISYYLFGVKPWGYHLFNLVLNVVASSAVFLIISELIERHAGKGESTLEKTGFALAGALIFALHPIHTEVVAWASAMAELEASCFGLFAVYLYIRSEGAMGAKYIASVILFSLAIFTKETATGYLLLVAAYDYCIRGRLEFRRYVPFAAVFIAYFGIRTYALGSITVKSRHPELTGYEVAINALPLFAKYFWKLLFPANLNVFHVLHPIRSLLEWKGIISIVFTAAYAAALFFSRGAWRFALFWMALPLLPVLYIRTLGDNTFAERYLYLPSVGFALMAALAAHAAVTRAKDRRKALIVVAVTVAVIGSVYAAAVVKRNTVWKNNFTLWDDSVKTSYDDAVPVYTWATELEAVGRSAEAEAGYKKAIEMDPKLIGAHNNLGNLWLSQGKPAEAAGEFNIVLGIDPNYIPSLYNLGNAYKALGRKDEAERLYLKTISLFSGYMQAHNNLGVLYSEMGRTDDAIKVLQEAAKKFPGYADVRYNLGNIYRAKGMLNEAGAEFVAAVIASPGYVAAHNGLGLVYAQKGLLAEAEKAYRTAKAIAPDNFSPYANLGDLYLRHGRHDLAVDEFKAAVRLNPGFAGAHYGLGRAYELNGRRAEAEIEFREAARIAASSKKR